MVIDKRITLSDTLGEKRARIIKSARFADWCGGYGIDMEELNGLIRTAESLSPEVPTRERLRCRCVLNNLAADFLGEEKHKIHMRGEVTDLLVPKGWDKI